MKTFARQFVISFLLLALAACSGSEAPSPSPKAGPPVPGPSTAPGTSYEKIPEETQLYFEAIATRDLSKCEKLTVPELKEECTNKVSEDNR